jgi:hypothetical protein
VEFAFLPGEANDVRGLDVLPMDLPPDSYVYGDGAYTDYAIEDIWVIIIILITYNVVPASVLPQIDHS